MASTLVIANAGVPMLIIYGPVLLIALVPIIVLESAIINHTANIGFAAMSWRVGLANAVSTLMGVPLTWLALVLIQMFTGGGSAHGVGLHAVTWQAPWLIPYEDDLHWMVPAAGLVLTVPFWFVSVVIESKVLNRTLRQRAFDAGISIKRLCFVANTWSYALLGVFWAVPLVMDAVQGK